MESYPLDLKYVVDLERDERIADELTAIRERGLEHLYAPTGGQRPKSFPELQPQADAFCGALHLPAFGPTATMGAMLRAAVSAYARWGHRSQSKELYLLFFDPEGTPRRRRPHERLIAARDAAKLDEKRFYQYQRTLFRDFAPFLDAFVTAAIREAAPQLPPPEQDQEPAEEPENEHHDEHAEAAQPPPQGSQLSVLLALVLAAGLVATILVMVILRPTVSASLNRSASPITVTGYVKCSPNASKPVVGVWIVAGNGGSGWADWHTLPGQANVAWFSRTLPNGGSYVVHVGCGGTPQHWDLALTSITEVLGSGYTFTCYDAPSLKDPTQFRCQP